MLLCGDFSFSISLILTIFFFLVVLFSFKKTNNAQGGQSRGGLPTVNSTDSSNAPNPRGVQNGESVRIQSLGILFLNLLPLFI